MRKTIQLYKNKLCLNLLSTECFQIMKLIYIYRHDWALNNLQWLICHKAKLNQTLTWLW